MIKKEFLKKYNKRFRYVLSFWQVYLSIIVAFGTLLGYIFFHASPFYTIQEIAYQQQQENLKREYVQLHNDLAISYLYDEKVNAAKAELNKTLEMDPFNKEAIMYLFECDVFSKASVYNRDYDPDILYKQLEELLKDNPNDPVLYLYLGDFYYNSNNTSEALGNYQHAIELDRNISGAYEQIGLLYKHEGKMNESIANLTKAYNLSPWNLGYQENIAGAYAQIKDYQNATQWYNKTLDLDEYHLLSYYGLAQCYRLQNRTNDALKTQEYLLQCLNDEEITNLTINSENITWSINGIGINFHTTRKYYAYYDTALTCYLLGNESLAMKYVSKAKAVNISLDSKSRVKKILNTNLMELQKNPQFTNETKEYQKMLNDS